MTSLAEALVRDGTSRHFRWLRGSDVTRTSKVPVTMVTGKPRLFQNVPPAVLTSIQRCLGCGCRLSHCTLFTYLTAKIGGHRFSAGEKLRRGTRCGSVVVAKRGGVSVYGLIKQFFRVSCSCDHFTDLVSVTWFPVPEYPDNDPLTVRILLHDVDVNNILEVDVLSLNDIQPSRIIVDLDSLHNCMYMLRIEGLDNY